MLRIGLISDTHGLLRPEALAWLDGSDHIVHGGDIGDAGILDALARIAPLSVVRGNNDTAPWARDLPASLTLMFGAVRLHVLHNLAELDVAPATTGIGVIMSGHSHRPRIERRDGVWYVNPGSAGPRRFKLPISVGELRIAGDAIEPRLATLG